MNILARIIWRVTNGGKEISKRINTKVELRAVNK